MLTFNFVYLLQLCTFQDLICHYFVPVFVFATWLVVTTFLHHQVWFGPRCYQQGPVPLSHVYVISALCAIRKLFYLEGQQNHIVISTKCPKNWEKMQLMSYVKSAITHNPGSTTEVYLQKAAFRLVRISCKYAVGQCQSKLLENLHCNCL